MRGCLVFKVSSLITPHSIFVTHHSSLKIPQFPIPHTFDTITQLYFQPKKPKKIGPTHSNLTYAPDLLPGPINSTNQLKHHFTITFLLNLYSTHRWFLPPSSSLKPSPQHLSLNILTPHKSQSNSPRNFHQGLKSIRRPCSDSSVPPFVTHSCLFKEWVF